VDAGSDPHRRRLAGLDGIRGLAALYVVVNHIFLRAFPGYPVDHAPFWAGWFIYGRFAVVVFIVLSGFSLALSPARHGWRLDSVRRFASRRARRILPAYWAALAFSLAVAWLVVPPPGQGAPTGRSVLVNGLLVQNLVGAPSPNRSFWSMAVEAQLYVFFPLLLLMVRRFGAAVMVGTVTLMVAAVGIFGPHVSKLDTFVIQSPPDLAALFAVGILAAGIAGASGARRDWPWHWFALAAAAPVLATIWWRGSVWTLDHLFWVDLALGPAVACLLVGLAAGRPAALMRLLETRPIRGLGLSSYSLYLTHGPIVVLVYEKVVGPRFGHGAGAFLATFALAVPLTIAFARLFSELFETTVRRRRSWSWGLPLRWGRAAGSAAIFAILVWRLGTGPFLDGIRTIDAGALAAAFGLALLTTACCAWRWTIVARGLGVSIPLRSAVAAYYRSLFLNVTLPGGVVGDVHRGLTHGRDVSDVGRALRAVGWERFAGQVVQLVLTVAVLLVLPSPVHSAMPFVTVGLVVAAACLVLTARRWPPVRRDVRDGLLPRRAWPAIALASALVVAGHAATFVIAARTAGIHAPLSHLLPLAMLVMLIMVVPSAGGWGPREGGSAWAFGAVGLGASRGVTTAVIYGVMVLVATLPGAAVLVVSWVRRIRPARGTRIGEEALHA
jgi:peptidoglycan/LPS O-acetylase OafA/YrhL